MWRFHGRSGGCLAGPEGIGCGCKTIQPSAFEQNDGLFTEPVSPLVSDAVKLHETFKALVQAGFTERQACYLLGAMIAAHSPEETP
jgi:hypothetical protein